MRRCDLLTSIRILLVSVFYARLGTASATTGMTTSTPSQIGGEDTAAPVADNGGAIARIENYI